MFPKNGFTFIDILIGAALLIIVFTGILGAYQLGMKVVGQSKARTTAIALANQKIEMARNLSYQGVGTIGGIPAGQLNETEIITRNGAAYTVKTTVVYIDDSLDGLIPADAQPSDYKRVKVKVSWQGQFGGGLALLTDVAPKEIWSEAGGGMILISVFDAEGIGVPQANISITNSAVNPAINAWYLADNNGNLVLPGAPTSNENYQITASKAGFSTDRTYGAEETTNPLKPHVSVYDGRLAEASFSIDETGSFSVRTSGAKEQGYPAIPNVPFALRGAKIIGTDAQGAAVYKYSDNFLTNNDGELNVGNLEWDSYSFTVNKLATGFDLIGAESPLATTSTQPIDLLPNISREVRLILKAENSFLVTVKDEVSLQPIFGASIRIFNAGLGYDETYPSDENGRAFFIPLEAATYNLEIGASGYQIYTGNIFVSGEKALTVNLVASP